MWLESPAEELEDLENDRSDGSDEAHAGPMVVQTKLAGALQASSSDGHPVRVPIALQAVTYCTGFTAVCGRRTMAAEHGARDEGFCSENRKRLQ